MRANSCIRYPRKQFNIVLRQIENKYKRYTKLAQNNLKFKLENWFSIKQNETIGKVVCFTDLFYGTYSAFPSQMKHQINLRNKENSLINSNAKAKWYSRDILLVYDDMKNL